jgi:glyoxylase-like metal-dependent hydrolase (beta-lactamase superfamily II)
MPIEPTVHSLSDLPPLGTNAYLLVNPERREAVLIDAPAGVRQAMEPVLREAGAKLVGLILTHGHFDHTLEAAAVRSDGLATWAHAGDREFFENPEIMRSLGIPGIDMPPVEIDHWVEPGTPIEVAGLTFDVRHTPGHSPGSITLVAGSTPLVFSGDVLFQGSVGRTDFPGCSFAELEASIRTQLYPLPERARVYPGHGPETTLGHERRTNPFVHD